MASIKCGKCKGAHETVAEVRACYGQNSETAKPRETRETPVEKLNRLLAEIPETPHLRFALDTEEGWKFYQLDRPQSGKWKGWTFLKVQASDDTWPIKNFGSKLLIIEKLTEVGYEKAVADYGLQIGSCGICGRTLTDPASIERGIGPICIAKMGW